MSVPGRCSSCHRTVLQTWTCDVTGFDYCLTCLRELLEWPPLLTVEDLLRRIRGPLGDAP